MQQGNPPLEATRGSGSRGRWLHCTPKGGERQAGSRPDPRPCRFGPLCGPGRSCGPLLAPSREQPTSGPSYSGWRDTTASRQGGREREERPVGRDDPVAADVHLWRRAAGDNHPDPDPAHHGHTHARGHRAAHTDAGPDAYRAPHRDVDPRAGPDEYPDPRRPVGDLHPRGRGCRRTLPRRGRRLDLRGRLHDDLYDILLLPDGGTLLAGRANSPGPSQRITPGTARLIRTGAEGTVAWEKDQGGEDDATFYSPIQEGDEVWTQTYGMGGGTGTRRRLQRARGEAVLHRPPAPLPAGPALSQEIVTTAVIRHRRRPSCSSGRTMTV